MTDPLLEFQPKNNRDLSLDRHVTTIKEESNYEKNPTKKRALLRKEVVFLRSD